MTYASFDAYRADYQVCQNAAQAFHGVIGQTKFVDPQIGWKLYQNALKPVLGFQTFGRHVTGEKGKELLKFRGKHPTAPLPSKMIGMNHSEGFFKNFGVVNDEKDGSILLMGGGKWNFTINDSWLLGGINGKNDFYAASPIVKKNVIDKDYVLSITGRELLGLAMFGYRMVSTTHGLGFIPGDNTAAENANLVDYQALVASLKKASQAEAFFKSKGYKL
jgi:hypothetical protein